MVSEAETMSKYREGARKAWATRKRKGWKRKTVEDRKLELLGVARKKLKGAALKQANKWLQHRFRSKSREADMVAHYEDVLKN